VLYEFKSSEDFDASVVNYLVDKTNRQQFKFKQFTNEDYREFHLEKTHKQDCAFIEETDYENEKD
jgi:hypothetical protein